jgi:DNA-binding transcriptional LysR family regulator
MKLTDEAVDAALDVAMDDGHNGLDCRPERNFGDTMRAALEAALPHLEGATPVADKAPRPLETLPPGSLIRAHVTRWSVAREWPDDSSDVLMELDDEGYWSAVEDDPAAPFTVVPACRSSITVLSVERVGNGEGATPAIDREALAAAAHQYYCVMPNEPTHEPDDIDYDKADEILEILALIGGAS